MDIHLNTAVRLCHLLTLLKYSLPRASSGALLLTQPHSWESQTSALPVSCSIKTSWCLSHTHGPVLWKLSWFFLIPALDLQPLPTSQHLLLIPNQVLDGRRPTGGRLEVMVRIREPLTAQQLETTTERWLVIDPVPAAVPTVRPPPPPRSNPRDGGNQGGQASQDRFCPLKQVAGPKGKAPPMPVPTREPGNR